MVRTRSGDRRPSQISTRPGDRVACLVDVVLRAFAGLSLAPEAAAVGRVGVGDVSGVPTQVGVHAAGVSETTRTGDLPVSMSSPLLPSPPLPEARRPPPPSQGTRPGRTGRPPLRSTLLGTSCRTSRAQYEVRNEGHLIHGGCWGVEGVRRGRHSARRRSVSPNFSTRTLFLRNPSLESRWWRVFPSNWRDLNVPG